jgi:hypothetical protein
VPKNFENAFGIWIADRAFLQLHDDRLTDALVEHQQIGSTFNSLVPAARQEFSCRDVFMRLHKNATAHTDSIRNNLLQEFRTFADGICKD